MPRRPRSLIGGYVYHVLNRANGGLPLFTKDADFLTFEQTMAEAFERFPLRIIGYTVLPDHWQFVVWPRRGQDDEVSEFFRWLTVTHSLRWRSQQGTIGMGHVYQGRFKSFPIQPDEHLTAVLRSVEASPLRARRVRRADAWRWGSLYRRLHGTAEERALLSDSPVPPGTKWLELVNRPQSKQELVAIERCIARGQPYGDADWQQKTAQRLDLEHTFRARGRPKKLPPPEEADTSKTAGRRRAGSKAAKPKPAAVRRRA
jgi:putative transposase